MQYHYGLRNIVFYSIYNYNFLCDIEDSFNAL
jgi:hypothetical protein